MYCASVYKGSCLAKAKGRFREISVGSNYENETCKRDFLLLQAPWNKALISCNKFE